MIILTIQGELRRSVDVIQQNISFLTTQVGQKGLPDRYAEDLKQIEDATQKLSTLVDKINTPPPMGNPAQVKNFASILRHDMRTPVNVIRGYSEIIVEEAAQDALEVQKHLKAIISATDDILSNILKIVGTSWKKNF